MSILGIQQTATLAHPFKVFEGIDKVTRDRCVIKVLKPVAAKKVKREIKVLLAGRKPAPELLLVKLGSTKSLWRRRCECHCIAGCRSRSSVSRICPIACIFLT